MNSMRETTVKKRQFVIDTAIRLFTERGYEQVTVDDIIAEAGISKGTFYHYFKGKDEIVRDIGQRQMERIEEWQKETPSKVQSVEGHINRLFLNLAADIKEHPRFVRSLLTLGLQNEEIRKNPSSTAAVAASGSAKVAAESKKGGSAGVSVHGNGHDLVPDGKRRSGTNDARPPGAGLERAEVC